MAQELGRIVITGGAGGIGAATAKCIANLGGTAISIDQEENRECESHIADVAEESELVPVLERIGPINGLVCVAGINARGRVEDLSWNDWRRVMAVNIRGALLAMKHAQIAEHGAIVLTSSISAHIGCDGYTAYHTSKGGVLGLMRAASGEFAPQRIRVNAISPGWVDTAFTDRALREIPGGEQIREQAGHAHILGRMARASEIGEAICFLLSDSASFVTGAELVVDGGFLRKR